jgi:hypothetical protein
VSPAEQLLVLLILGIPVASVAWTVTHEEIFREPREWCLKKSKTCRSLFERKFFYLFTCEYCFSHWVTIGVLILSRFTLILPGWRGYILSFFALVWVANAYMSLFGRLRIDIKHERLETDLDEQILSGDLAKRLEAEKPKPASSQPAKPPDTRGL